MEPVEAGDGIEGAGVEIVGEAKGQAEVLHHLAAQEGEAQGRGHQ
jgi:hypothetical protein